MRMRRSSGARAGSVSVNCVGVHLLLDFGDGGGQVWLANTTLADLVGVDVVV